MTNRNPHRMYFLLLPILLLGWATGCDNDEVKPETRCTMNTFSLTPPGTVFTAHYNSKNQLTELSNCCDDGWIGTTYAYDLKGNLAFASNWTFTYDNTNRLIQIGRPLSELTEDYTYNAHGQLASVTSNHFGSGGPPITWVYTYTYPNNTTSNFSTVLHSDGATETFEYDHKPNPFKLTWLHLGAAYFLTWDRPCYHTDNNITKSIYTLGETTITSTYEYEYNDLGYPTSIEVEQQVISPSGNSTLRPPPIAITYTCR